MRCYFLRGGHMRASRYCPSDFPTKMQSRGLTRSLQSARAPSMALRFGIAPASSSGAPQPTAENPSGPVGLNIVKPPGSD